MLHLHKTHRVRIITILILVVLAGGILTPIPPSGRFYYPNVASEGAAFLAFDHGQVSVVIFYKGDTRPSYNYSAGSYHREKRKWVFVPAKGSPFSFHCNLLWARFRLPDGQYDTLWRRSF